MTIEEAIKTSIELLGSGRLHHYPEAQAAVQLQIEALKQIKEARSYGLFLGEAVLPGKTDEPPPVKA
ncbi:hypothetical protein ES703_84659 [subsurface metagenome]